MSKSEPPKEFSERIRIHNQRAFLSSFLCFFGTLICWGLGWFLFQWFTLFILSTIFGESARIPSFLHYIYMGILLIFYIWALMDALSHRFPVAQDRILFGWKEIKDILLALPRMTFGIFGNLRAILTLSRKDRMRAWELLCEILQSERSTFHTLASVEPHPRRRLSLLNTLQILKLIDLHTSREEDFFFLVRSDQEEWLKTLCEEKEEPQMHPDAHG